jgi:Zn-finger nucleic acid-binding protein
VGKGDAGTRRTRKLLHFRLPVSVSFFTLSPCPLFSVSLFLFSKFPAKIRTMHAETLNCPNCGAASSTDAPLCQFCGSKLATIACPKCFAMMFIGSRHCQRCGAAAAVPEVKDSKPRKCPRCKTAMISVTIGATSMLECEKCFGLWLDVGSFEKVCADREQQSAVLGMAAHAPSAATATSKVNYVPCPECSQLMNRMNFARCSGVIVDICKQHGTWFDRDELNRIVEFISDGGLNTARAKERMAIAEEREQLREEQRAFDLHRAKSNSDHRLTGIASTSGLLKFLLEK